MESEAQHKLELMIDAYGLASVLDAMSDVCSLKASHIAEHWQDMPLAKAWTRASDALGKLSGLSVFSDIS